MRKAFVMSILCSLCLLTACKQSAPMTLHWEMGANDVEPGVCEMYLTITNTSKDVIESNGWKLYFGFMSLHPLYRDGDPLRETELVASYHSIEPTETFTPLQPNESRTFTMHYRGGLIRESSAPEGFFLVRQGEQPITIPCTYSPFTHPEQMKRGIVTWEKTPYADGSYLYDFNEHVLNTDTPSATYVLPLFPQPKKVTMFQGSCLVRNAEFLLLVDSTIPAEGYRLDITQDRITLASSDDSGAYYAQTTLRQLGDSIPCMTISDWPDLPHRGVMLDVVRHYYPVDSVKRILDVMAELKLNVLHFHISDDEAWRLEIPGLPELTHVGAKRGYTTTESDCLVPVYSGGWDANDARSMSNGYMTCAQYIDLLQYAKERAIRVIPEIDMPGHMRACKKAMHGLLTDSVLEKRPYVSAQNYTDNVIAVNNPYAIAFMDTVITAIVRMHDQAGCPLTQFNIGGDEVPNGALTKEEHQAFIDAVLAILNRYHLQPMGWEEIGHFCSVESNPVCYAWHSNDTKPRELAEAGYPVVIASASHLYFDFAYCNHHEEKGLNWGGYGNEYSAFDWLPLIHKNVVGLNAQLWSEVIRSFEQVEWQLFPKMYGLSERAWNNRSNLSLAQYNTLVYDTALPRLASQGHAFHLWQPGINLTKNTDGSAQIDINKVMTGGDIQYCINDDLWQNYEGSFTLNADEVKQIRTIKARISYLGRESNTTWLWVN